MSNQDNNNNDVDTFSESITKNLVKKITEDNINANKDDDYDDFNIDYNGYEEEDIDAYEENNSPKKRKSKSSSNKKSENKYRKNIDEYSDDFFSDDDYEEDEHPSLLGRIISICTIIALIISTTFFAVNLKITKNQLKDANAEIQELIDKTEDAESKLTEESLKTEVASLKLENENLKGNTPVSPSDSTTQATTSQSNNTTTTNNNNANNTTTTNNNSNNSSSTEYIVQEGDIIWNISKKIYGNGGNFQKILDANGLKENDILKPGQKLIIPKIN